MSNRNSLEADITNIIFNTCQIIVSKINDTIGFTPHFVCEINGPYYPYFRKLINLVNPKQSKRIHLQLYALKINNNSKEIKSHKYVEFSKETVLEYGLKNVKTPSVEEIIEVKKFQYSLTNRANNKELKTMENQTKYHSFDENIVKYNNNTRFELHFPYPVSIEPSLDIKEESDWDSDMELGGWIISNKAITPDSDPPFHQYTKKSRKHQNKQNFSMNYDKYWHREKLEKKRVNRKKFYCKENHYVANNLHFNNYNRTPIDRKKNEEIEGLIAAAIIQSELRTSTVSPSQLTKNKKQRLGETSSFIILNHCDYKNLRRIEEVTFLLVFSILNGVLNFEKCIMQASKNISANVRIATENRQAYTIHNISDIINSSPCHLHRLFTKFTGITLKDYENLCLEFLNTNHNHFKLLGDNINLWVKEFKGSLNFDLIFSTFISRKYNYTKFLSDDPQKKFNSWSLYLLLPGTEEAIFRNKVLLNPPLLPSSRINHKQRRLREKKGGNSGPNQFRISVGPLRKKIRAEILDTLFVIDTSTSCNTRFQFNIEKLFSNC
ncbi:hypothetical protein RI543_003765 [Arxiozyma heterogenica]|uniref:Uncharacterized protein n=1 Tax=Arxiozyma heterogenica TaxID=278026 RepID=A0AAN7WKI4_9SACH|nr:hypothetical protein RI543_003765 [Kazachstania heterogenica]